MNKSSKTKITPLGDNYYMRENPKKFGEYQYKRKYRYKDTEGNTHHTETRWCPTKEIAFKEATEQQRNYGLKTSVNGTIGEYFQKYIDDLKKKTRKTRKTTNKLSTLINEKESASGLYNKQMPDYVKDTFIKDFDSQLISKWIRYIDNGAELEEELSISSVRRKKLIISKFVDFMSSYLPSNQITDLQNAINNHKVQTKNNFGKRTDRVELDNKHLIALFNHYLSGDYSFGNYYWHTLFLTLFCTGMRVGELVALQWKDIQLDKDPANSVIYINKSIHEKEFPEHAIATIKAGNGTPKNKYSKREVNIFTANRNALIIYKKLCFYHYYLECGYTTMDDMDDDFVFRNYRSRNNSQYYQTHKNILKELKNTSNKIGIPASDAQMFRHATCRFLVLDCGHYREDVFEYFGHSSIDMIDEVYSRLNETEQRIRSSRIMKDLIGSDVVERIHRGIDHTMINYLNHDISKNRNSALSFINELFIFNEIIVQGYLAERYIKEKYILECDKESYSTHEWASSSISDTFKDLIKNSGIKSGRFQYIKEITENPNYLNELNETNKSSDDIEEISDEENNEAKGCAFLEDYLEIAKPLKPDEFTTIPFVLKNKLIEY